jgi:hypothetical protein
MSEPNLPWDKGILVIETGPQGPPGVGAGGPGGGAAIDDAPEAAHATDKTRSANWITHALAVTARIDDAATNLATDRTWSAARINAAIQAAIEAIGEPSGPQPDPPPDVPPDDDGDYTPPPWNAANIDFR